MSFQSRGSRSPLGFGLPPPPPSAINLYITLCPDCSTRTLHMPKPAKPLKMRSRSSSSSFANSSLDLTVATSCGLILQICLIMTLSLRCRFVLVNGQVSLAWWRTARKSCIHVRGSCNKRWRDVRTGSICSMLNHWSQISKEIMDI